MNVSTNLGTNAILDSLPESDFGTFKNNCKLVKLEYAQVLYETAESIQHIHFPLDSIVSLIYETIEGKSAEIASIGNNGAVGCDILLSESPSRFRALTIHSGWAYQFRKADILHVFNKLNTVHYQLKNYIQTLTTEISLNGVCSRFHKIEQQFCKFLLLYSDRVSGRIPLTQETIAHLLGVRRESITDIASKLQKANILDYTRGQIEILDRIALENRSCECYHVTKAAAHSQYLIAA
ncbi:Crp/Fnr family transcriptional regulator [Nitrosomonas ureae]|uniref:cAMP-binding domain of CRP or a regulatory subunit of cAMP-dependent protein kinases n=1 Tax=Nitrosomonas ureae TaxID=44577 RepID=A0A286AKJ6_9PROT|nr:Crp/Fnr family transcriptional regulator [Nitrosomonas ureae]SOD22418.1 cAMP-binding domain of CRP or a regulatory subunit of cAMP-dependent protein kinases [Nitrosomonas ureae]